MTGPAGNSAGETKLTVSSGATQSAFSYLPTQKLDKHCVCLTPAGTQICLGFKAFDLITCESKVQLGRTCVIYYACFFSKRKAIIERVVVLFICFDLRFPYLALECCFLY